MRNTTPARSRATTDLAILDLLRKRDEDGLTALLLQHGGRVRSALLGKFGLHRASDVDDAMSEATFRVWNRIDDFDASRSDLGAWFYLIARNSLITSLRSQAAVPLTDVLGIDGFDAGIPRGSWDGTHDGVDARRQLLADLDGCIQRLGKVQRDIVLSDLEAGEPVGAKVLAERWNTTPNTIWVARNRAHASLRRCLRHKGHGR